MLHCKFAVLRPSMLVVTSLQLYESTGVECAQGATDRDSEILVTLKNAKMWFKQWLNIGALSQAPIVHSCL